MRMHWRRQMFTVVLLVGIIMVAGGASGGLPAYIPAQIRGAAAVGIDALFIETHPDPDRAPCDGACQIRLEELDRLVSEVCAIRTAVANARC